jgi:hypothetical protein
LLEFQEVNLAMARLTLARKMAAITLTMWKKGANFNAKELNRQTA